MFRRRRSTFRRSARRSLDPRVLIGAGVAALVALIAAGVYFVGVADRSPPPRTEQRIEIPDAIKP